MIGASAQLSTGAPFGRVVDVVVTNQGFLQTVIVASQQRFIAIPFNLVQVDFTRRIVFVDVIRERLLNFPSFGTLAEFQGLGTLLRTSVRLRAGGTFGLMEDFILSTTGRIDFLVLAFQQRLFAVPFSLARLNVVEQTVLINVTRERLLRAPSFTWERPPDFSWNSPFSQRVHSFFGMRTPTQPPATRMPTAPPQAVQPPTARPPAKRPPIRTPTQPPSIQPPSVQPAPRPPAPHPPMHRPTARPPRPSAGGVLRGPEQPGGRR